MKILKTISLIIFIGFLFMIYENLMAFKDGIVGFTKKNGNETGCVCHGFDPNDSVRVVISGPTSVRAGDSAIFVLTLTKGPAIAGGCDISTSLGNVYPSELDTALKREEPFSGAGFELTHKNPQLFINDTLKFIFKYKAPSTPNVVDTIFANGNSTNNDVTSDNDKWNYANSFLVNILPTIGISSNNADVNSFALEQNYPNPFNPKTVINYYIPVNNFVSLKVYDILGNEVSTLVNEKQFAGYYSAEFDGSNLNSGVYFYRLTVNSDNINSGNFSEVKRMMLIK